MEIQEILTLGKKNPIIIILILLGSILIASIGSFFYIKNTEATNETRDEQIKLLNQGLNQQKDYTQNQKKVNAHFQEKIDTLSKKFFLIRPTIDELKKVINEAKKNREIKQKTQNKINIALSNIEHEVAEITKTIENEEETRKLFNPFLGTNNYNIEEIIAFINTMENKEETEKLIYALGKNHIEEIIKERIEEIELEYLANGKPVDAITSFKLNMGSYRTTTKRSTDQPFIRNYNSFIRNYNSVGTPLKSFREREFFIKQQ